MQLLTNIIKYEKLLKENIKAFFENLKTEKKETQEAFLLLKEYVVNDKVLTQEEKHSIGEQLKDVFKVIGLSGIMILPGASVFLLLATFFKVNDYILPSSFKDKKDNI